jgi:hypothetical protein
LNNYIDAVLMLL